MPSYPFSAVLFDLDGVVIDSIALHREVWADFLRSHGLEPTEQTLQFADGRRAVEVIATLFPGPLLPADLKRLTSERESLYRHRLTSGPVRAVPGVEDYLAALRSIGVRTALATSALPTSTDSALRRLGLEKMFHARITAADVTHGKPHPEIYLKAALSVGIVPEQCLVAEDAVPGIQAAKAAGMHCLGLTTSCSGPELRSAGADYLSADFAGLPPPLRPC